MDDRTSTEGNQEKDEDKIEKIEVTFSGIPSVEELKENPFHYDAARTLIQELSGLKNFLLAFVEGSEYIQGLSNELVILFDLECMDEGIKNKKNVLEIELVRIVGELRDIENIIKSENPANDAHAHGYIKDYQASSFSFKSKIKALFNKEEIAEKRSAENNYAVSILSRKADEIIRQANQFIYAERDKINPGDNTMEMIQSIAQSSNPQEMITHAEALKRYVRVVAHISIISDMVDNLNKQINKRALGVSNGLTSRDSRMVYPNYIGDELRGRRTDCAHKIIPQKIDAFKEYLNSDASGMPYSNTSESMHLIESCNDLAQELLESKRDIISVYDQGKESREISKGRIITHAAFDRRMYEVLMDGELMSMEAQAIKKGRATRTHGTHLVKENYMDDRNSMESHSITFEIDSIYRTFIKAQDLPVVVLAFPENYFLSKGYLFDESDGEHLFDPEFIGKKMNPSEDRPASINLREVPVVFMVESEKYDEFCSFILNESVWKENLAAMSVVERDAWLSNRIFKRWAGSDTIPPIVRNRLLEMSGSPKKGFVGKTNIHGNLKKQDGATLKRFVLQK
ncbi:MAG: hypothetical protein WC823_05325 [Parcubacteria group bacterium]|jgi:hypothetical protein